MFAWAVAYGGIFVAGFRLAVTNLSYSEPAILHDNFWGLMGIVSVVATLLGGVLVDRWGTRRLLIRSHLVVLVVALALVVPPDITDVLLPPQLFALLFTALWALGAAGRWVVAARLTEAANYRRLGAWILLALMLGSGVLAPLGAGIDAVVTEAIQNLFDGAYIWSASLFFGILLLLPLAFVYRRLPKDAPQPQGPEVAVWAAMSRYRVLAVLAGLLALTTLFSVAGTMLSRSSFDTWDTGRVQYSMLISTVPGLVSLVAMIAFAIGGRNFASHSVLPVAGGVALFLAGLTLFLTRGVVPLSLVLTIAEGMRTALMLVLVGSVLTLLLPRWWGRGLAIAIAAAHVARWDLFDWDGSIEVVAVGGIAVAVALVAGGMYTRAKTGSEVGVAG